MDSIMEPYIADLLADDITAPVIGFFYGGGGAADLQMEVEDLDAYLRAVGALPARPEALGADFSTCYGVAAAAGVQTKVSSYGAGGVLHALYKQPAVEVHSRLPPPPGFHPLPVPAPADEPVYAVPARLPPPPGFPPFPVPALAEPVYAAPVDEGHAIRTFMELLAWSEQYDAPVSRPQLCAPYDDDIEATLRAMEKDAGERPSPDYLKTVHGDKIGASERFALVGWMKRFTRKYDLAAGTLHRAVSYVDRFLSVRALPSYTDHQLSLRGAAAVYTAAKYEDQRTTLKLNAKDIASYGGFASAQEVLLMENDMVAALDYRLSGPTAETFVEHFTRHYSQGEEDEQEVQRLARDVADQSLKNYGCVGYLPSVVAAASISIARWTLNPPGALPWSTELEELTGYSSQDIGSCILTMMHHMNAQ